MIGLIRVVLAAIVATLFYGFRILWGAWRGRPEDRPMVEEGPRGWSLFILRAAGIRVVLENEEVIDPDRPQILVANHVSWFDVPALAGHLPGKYRFVAKQELTKVPIFGPAWQAAGHIAIDRTDRSKALDSLAEARRKLEADRPTVVMFPEGTRSSTGELRPFKKGAFILGIQTGVEVVPAAIIGSREVMAKGSWRVHTGRTIRVRFGAPIPVDGMDMKDRDSLTERAHRAVAELLVAEPPDSGR
jgi:1-acyl-sn-glycerol-3-phosphate acyltransferase